jgi:hypothetical protein
VAQLVARRLAVRQARVRFSARHHREGLPTDMNVHECEINVCMLKIRKINKKEWHPATKP